jgi:hypothetical protein
MSIVPVALTGEGSLSLGLLVKAERSTMAGPDQRSEVPRT